MPTPPADPIAQLMDRILSYCRSQGIGAIARLGIPDILLAGPKTAAELAERTGTDAEYLGLMLRALAVEGLFSQASPGLYGLTELSEGLTTDHPRSVCWLAASMCDHAHWQPWGRA